MLDNAVSKEEANILESEGNIDRARTAFNKLKEREWRKIAASRTEIDNIRALTSSHFADKIKEKLYLIGKESEERTRIANEEAAERARIAEEEAARTRIANEEAAERARIADEESTRTRIAAKEDKNALERTRMLNEVSKRVRRGPSRTRAPCLTRIRSAQTPHSHTSHTHY